MSCLYDFDEDIKAVFKSCKEVISSYPLPLRQEAYGLLQEYNIFSESFSRSYISFLLPFWLQDYYKIDKEIIKKISVGNVFGHLYFMQQDKIMDTVSGEYNGHLLPLANLFYLDFMEHYRSIFPGNSLFWTYLRKYSHEWAQSVTLERSGFWHKEQVPANYDLKLLAHKASPIKSTCAAVCILANSINDLERLEQALDKTIISFQILDDWVDRHEDQKNGSYTYFISQVMKFFKLEDISELDENHFITAVYTENLLENIFLTIHQNHSILESLLNSNFPYLLEYHKELLNLSSKILTNIRREKSAILHGGFYNYLESAKKH